MGGELAIDVGEELGSEDLNAYVCRLAAAAPEVPEEKKEIDGQEEGERDADGEAAFAEPLHERSNTLAGAGRCSRLG